MNLNDFWLGVLITCLILCPCLAYFGIREYRLWKLTKILEKEHNRPEPQIEIDPEVTSTLNEVSKLLGDQKSQSA